MTTRLNRQVREFHKLVGQDIGERPQVPTVEVVRLRGRVVIEEAFEFLEALTPPGWYRDYFGRLKAQAKSAVAEMAIKVDLPAAVDALADLDYVSEGSRIAFGVDGEPIADEVHRANMQKQGGGLDEHGKARKPAGWKPPDIRGCLKLQGAKGPWSYSEINRNLR
jgi:predicted HAD superfamily Cof-like phosphohydrolase